MDQFSYYDTISYLLPGLIFLWALSIFGPFPTNGLSLILTGNTIIDPILLLATSYLVGHVLQFLSKHSLAILMNRLFWNGHYFSEIFLISSCQKCNEIEQNRFLSFAEKELKIEKEKIKVLCDPEITINNEKMKTATEISHMIYRLVDAKSSDTSKGQKAQLQNTFYTFFRNVAMLFFILGILDLLALILCFYELNLNHIIVVITNFVLVGIFLYQSKQRAEYYVKGLFWSVA
jgi:hypothetical protein